MIIYGNECISALGEILTIYRRTARISFQSAHDVGPIELSVPQECIHDFNEVKQTLVIESWILKKTGVFDLIKKIKGSEHILNMTAQKHGLKIKS